LVQDLTSPSASRRERAAKQAAKLEPPDERVIDALTNVAADDPNPYPREAARRTLVLLGRTPPPVAPEFASKTIPREPLFRREFFSGAAVWLGLNAVLLILLIIMAQLRTTSLPLFPQLFSNDAAIPVLVIVPILLNIVGLVVLTTRQPLMAFGGLAAFTVLLLFILPFWLLVTVLTLPNP
jgi:hypothetical protein